MIGIISDGEIRPKFLMELFTVYEVGKQLSSVCYELEGDGPLIFRTYELVRRAEGYLKDDCRLPQPVIDLCIRLATDEMGVLNNNKFFENETYCRSILTPARQYFAGQLVKATVSCSLHVAKMAAMWNPLKARGMSLNDAMLSVTSSFYY